MVHVCLLCTALAVGLAGCASPSPTPELSTTPKGIVLRQNGFAGELELHRDALDLSVAEVESALGTDLLLAPQTEQCSLGIARGSGLAVVFDSTSTGVRAFVVEDARITTAEGIGLGATPEEVRATYGVERVAVLDGVASQTGGPVVVVDDLTSPGREPGPTSLHYAFDTDGAGRVTRIRAGFWPYVAYADYCSPAADRPARTGWPLTRGGG